MTTETADATTVDGTTESGDETPKKARSKSTVTYQLCEVAYDEEEKTSVFIPVKHPEGHEGSRDRKGLLSAVRKVVEAGDEASEYYANRTFTVISYIEPVIYKVENIRKVTAEKGVIEADA